MAADFTWTEAFVGIPTAFTSLSTGTFIEYDWDFGDGGTNTNSLTPTHIFTTAGTFSVVHRINVGVLVDDWQSITKTVRVGEKPPVLNKPTALFDASAQQITAGATVSFTNRSTGQISGYAWSFGDGTVTTSKDSSKQFNEAGNYNVSLTVFNESGSDTYNYRVDVLAPATVSSEPLGDTILDLISAIRGLLRRPSDLKLSYQDIREVIMDLLRGYSRDLQVSDQYHRTDETQCTIQHLDSNDYILTIPNVQDVEAMGLSYADLTEQANNQNVIWKQCTIVPLVYYAERHRIDPAVASFYGGLVVDNGIKVKLNLDQETVKKSTFKIRYQKPIIKILNLSAKTPLPADFLPMIKMEAAMNCLARIQDDSKEFYQWRSANAETWAINISDWRRRWREFLDFNSQPTAVPKAAANDWRRRRSNIPQYTVERR